MDSCGSCRYARPVREIDRDAVGTSELECHRRPPVIFVVDGEASRAWPGVDPEDWCGEYRRIQRAGDTQIHIEGPPPVGWRPMT